MSFVSEIRALRWADWIRPILAAAISGGSSVFVSNPIATFIGAAQYTPRQLALNALALAITSAAGVLMKSPLPQRAVAVALLPGVHTPDEVDKILKNTAPGTVPTPEVAASILGLPPPGPTIPRK